MRVPFHSVSSAAAVPHAATPASAGSTLRPLLALANVFSIVDLPPSLQFGTFLLAMAWAWMFVALAVRIGVKSVCVDARRGKRAAASHSHTAPSVDAG